MAYFLRELIMSIDSLVKKTILCFTDRSRFETLSYTPIRAYENVVLSTEGQNTVNARRIQSL